MDKKRVLYFDLLKAFAAFLVILGHIITAYDVRRYDAPFAIWIYSFHMPLFMILSGLFFYKSSSKNFVTIFSEKVRQLLFPLLSWSIIALVLDKLIRSPFSSWGGLFLEYLRNGGPLHGLWFLKCLFLCYMLSWMILRICKNGAYSVFLLFFIILLMPDLNFSTIMFPFFWVGYLLNKHWLIIHKNQIWIFIVSIIVMILSLMLWNSKWCYVYKNMHFVPYFMRFLIGVSSSLFWILLFKFFGEYIQKKVCIFNLLIGIGTSTLGIYCCQEYFYYKHISGFIFDLFPPNNILIYIMASSVIISACYILILLMRRKSWVALVLLGEKIKK